MASLTRRLLLQSMALIPTTAMARPRRRLFGGLAQPQSPSQSLNLADLGVHPSGDPSSLRQAIQSVVDRAFDAGHPVEVVIPSGLYAIDGPIICRPNVSLRGDGDATIKNVRNGFDAYSTAIFVPGNFHPGFTQKLRYEPISYSAGGNTVQLQDGQLAAKYRTGDTVVIASKRIGKTVNLNLPEYMRLNEVTGTSGTTLELRYPLDAAYDAGIVRLDGSQPGRQNIPLFVYKNAKISNLTLITNGHIFADSATLNVSFEKLTIQARSCVYGNAFQHTQWSNINATFYHLIGEQSHNSYNTSCSDFTFVYKPQEHDGSPGVGAMSASSPQEGISLQENATGIVYQRGSIDMGAFPANNPIISIHNAMNCQFNDINCRVLPPYNGTAIYIGVTEANGRVPCSGNTIARVVINGPCARYLLVEDQTKNELVSNNTVKNCQFVGHPTSAEALRLSGLVKANYITGNQFASGGAAIAQDTSRQQLHGNRIIGGIRGTPTARAAVLQANDIQN